MLNAFTEVPDSSIRKNFVVDGMKIHLGIALPRKPSRLGYLKTMEREAFLFRNRNPRTKNGKSSYRMFSQRSLATKYQSVRQSMLIL